MQTIAGRTSPLFQIGPPPGALFGRSSLASLHRNSTPRWEKNSNCQRMDPVPIEGGESDKGILGVVPASSGDRKSRCHVERGMRSERMIHIFGRTMDFGASTACRSVVGIGGSSGCPRCRKLCRMVVSVAPNYPSTGLERFPIPQLTSRSTEGCIQSR